jgi:hypothetical protein
MQGYATLTEPKESEVVTREWSVPTAKVGRSANKRVKAVKELTLRLQHETRKAPDGRIIGPLQPCTIINFNPLRLVVQGQLRLTIEKPGTTDHHQVNMPFMGRVYKGHYCYVASAMQGERKPDKEPTYYTTTTGHEQDSILPIDVPTSEARVFSPHSIACELFNQYNSPSMKLMGGILMFDQGPHMLSPDNLRKTEGRIYVPEREKLGDSWQYSYSLRETTLEEELTRIFTTQREYMDIVLQQAHGFWSDQDPASRKMITDTHRDWARYAKDMNYLNSLPEWVTAKLDTATSMADLLPCPQCGTQQPNLSTWFCRTCNAPYNAFKAFMAGKVVPQVYLELLEGEELELVQQKLAERKAKFADFAPAPAATAAAAAPKGKTSRAKTSRAKTAPVDDEE